MALWRTPAVLVAVNNEVLDMLDSAPDELGHRLALDRCGSLELLPEIGIEAQTSRTIIVSPCVTGVIYRLSTRPRCAGNQAVRVVPCVTMAQCSHVYG